MCSTCIIQSRKSEIFKDCHAKPGQFKILIYFCISVFIKQITVVLRFSGRIISIHINQKILLYCKFYLLHLKFTLNFHISNFFLIVNCFGIIILLSFSILWKQLGVAKSTQTHSFQSYFALLSTHRMAEVTEGQNRPMENKIEIKRT